MLWLAGFILLFFALMIPVLAIVLDSPAVRNLLESRKGGAGVHPDRLEELSGKVSMLEDQVDELGRTVEGLKEETQFLQRLLESPERRPPGQRLSPPKS
jgi:hypothetical protein